MIFKKVSLFFFSIMLFHTSLAYSQETYNDILGRTYVPADQELYETILALDKKLFDAYNSCDMDTQTALYSEDLEFFHDKGGLSTSKEKLLIALKENICQKVTRTLIEGSIEVYPIKDYGAVEIGYHTFNDKKTPENKSKGSRFIMIWKKTDDNWTVTRVISLH
ncbi:nuclear transport factor 2 family protein [Aurantibacter crassamenti]|uniref:nuclear transport factor 2 family protein n=1 Tax=Aurantibacter crassamenti TaxID=1837375 RepID=UPI001939B063|nr:nuclear transport factor 2 family protein [Aurantibacter crassamenti]MBM1107051.1 nuclear transport factor 2 family protein [Aurantibacter crassamenti]